MAYKITAATQFDYPLSFYIPKDCAKLPAEANTPQTGVTGKYHPFPGVPFLTIEGWQNGVFRQLVQLPNQPELLQPIAIPLSENDPILYRDLFAKSRETSEALAAFCATLLNPKSWYDILIQRTRKGLELLYKYRIGDRVAALHFSRLGLPALLDDNGLPIPFEIMEAKDFAPPPIPEKFLRKVQLDYDLRAFAIEFAAKVGAEEAVRVVKVFSKFATEFTFNQSDTEAKCIPIFQNGRVRWWPFIVSTEGYFQVNFQYTICNEPWRSSPDLVKRFANLVAEVFHTPVKPGGRPKFSVGVFLQEDRVKALSALVAFFSEVVCPR